ncbi:MAG: carbohydrate binding domain-containing protein [Clostridia bacterium]|nr:carbohydrate binding domain-containing protein [Clostridia bacterium]
MKKVTAILLCVLICISFCFSSVASGEEYPVLTEVFTNASFETANGNYPLNWGFSGSAVSMTSENVKDGNISVKIDNENSAENPYVRQVVSNVAPGALYTISAWLNTQSVRGKGAVIKIEYYSNNEATPGNNLGFDITSDPFPQTNGEWQRVELTARAPENCHGMRVFFRLLGAGTIYYDAVSCKIKETVPTHFLTTDAVFYYSDMSAGKATVRTNTTVYPDMNTGTVDFVLKNGNSIIRSSGGHALTDGEVQYTFPLTNMKTKTEYQLSATVKSSTGTVLYTQTEKIYKYDRPKALANDGIYRIDNQPFYPIFGYHVATSQYSSCSEAGVNVVQTWLYNSNPEQIKKSLDRIASNRLYALVALYVGGHAAGHSSNIENTKTIVNLVKDHPAVFAYAIQDEPFLHSTSTEDLRNSYKIIRDIDDVHPVYMVDRYPDTYHVGGKYTDILCIDPYPGNSFDPHTYVADAVNTASALFGSIKPIYVILQAYQYRGYWPTENEFRNMQQQAFLEGAKGIGYYAFDESYNGSLLPQNERWSTLKNFYQKEALYNFAGGTIIEETNLESYRYRLTQQNEKYLITILNKDRTDKTVTIHTSLSSAYSLGIISGIDQNDLSFQNGTLTIKLAPSAAVLLTAENNAIAFTNGAGILNEKLTSGKMVIKNTASGSSKAFAALYKGNSLVKFYALDKVENTVTIPQLSGEDYKLKGFVWNSYSGLQPVSLKCAILEK